MKGTKRICANGHTYYKSSDCPVCPICENDKKPNSGLLARVSAPARRALVAAGISNEKDLRGFTIDELRKMHGIGPSALKILQPFLKG
jgi:biotin synthase-related radical SAM superfamily protein